MPFPSTRLALWRLNYGFARRLLLLCALLLAPHQLGCECAGSHTTASLAGRNIPLGPSSSLAVTRLALGRNDRNFFARFLLRLRALVLAPQHILRVTFATRKLIFEPLDVNVDLFAVLIRPLVFDGVPLDIFAIVE